MLRCPEGAAIGWRVDVCKLRTVDHPSADAPPRGQSTWDATSSRLGPWGSGSIGLPDRGNKIEDDEDIGEASSPAS